MTRFKDCHVTPSPSLIPSSLRESVLERASAYRQEFGQQCFWCYDDDSMTDESFASTAPGFKAKTSRSGDQYSLHSPVKGLATLFVVVQ